MNSRKETTKLCC